MEYKLIRNMYVVRVKKTVKSYLNTKRFGMVAYSDYDRLNALFLMTRNGLDRSSLQFPILKPLFHAMSLKREEVAKVSKGQGDNMNRYRKDKEYASLNGQLLNDCMKPTDVAMLILVIENNMKKEDNVSRTIYLF